MKLSLPSLTFIATVWMTAPALAAANGPESTPGYRLVETKVQFEAGADHYAPWPGAARTVHAGIGYIEPFGAARYACGNGFAEEKQTPVPAELKTWFAAHAADKNPLFCVYRMADGDLHVYDVVIGNQFDRADRNEHKDILVNVVVGGTGAYAGASGLWTGATLGRGAMKPLPNGAALPVSILKLMQGYLRLPQADGAK